MTVDRALIPGVERAKPVGLQNPVLARMPDPNILLPRDLDVQNSPLGQLGARWRGACGVT